MFTQAELNALTSPLSNAARVLYCLALRPKANQDTLLSNPLQYKELLALMNSDPQREPVTRGREINTLLEELTQAGLVSLPESLSLDKSLIAKRVLLPFISKTQGYKPFH